MHKLQEHILSSTTLVFPNDKRKYTLDNNACPVQAGRELFQEQLEETTTSVGYWWQLLAKNQAGSQQRTPIVARNCLVCNNDTIVP